ncbi:hypothetical protein D3C72_1528330 [compost metagenome]
MHVAQFEFAHLHGLQVKAVRDDARHHVRRAAAAGDGARVTQQAAPGDGGDAAQLDVAESHHGKDIAREPVLSLPPEAHVIAVLAPGVVQQRQQPVVEEVQEGRTYPDTLSVLIGQPVQVITGQGRVRSMQAKKRGLHPIVAAGGGGHALGQRHVRGRKSKPRVAAQADAVALRVGALRGFQIVVVQAVQLLEQTEKVIVLRVSQQMVG